MTESARKQDNFENEGRSLQENWEAAFDMLSDDERDVVMAVTLPSKDGKKITLEDSIKNVE